MHVSEILHLRLHNTGLNHSSFKSAGEVVSHLGAVQAQDYPAAKWALGMRIKNSTDADIEKAFNDGSILRTHVMRPTWHFVMPGDIRWMLELTAPRIKTFMASYNRKLELTDALFLKTNKAIANTLKSQKYVTRLELKGVLEKMGIKTDVQRLAHIVMWAELDGLICSGPRQGKQFTYALMEERVPKAKKVSKDEALAKLALMYYASHGPAQLKDFSWWSGLKANEARDAVNLIKSKLDRAMVNEKEYWFIPVDKVSRIRSPLVRLVSIYDEYTIAYNDRSDLSENRDIERLVKMGSMLTAVILLDGAVTGTWKRTVKKNSVELKLSPFRKLSKIQKEAVAAEAERFGKFLKMEIMVSNQRL